MTKNSKNISPIAAFIDKRIEEISGVRNQAEIANIVGYQNQNMVTMVKQGKTKVAIDRVRAWSKALDTDFANLMNLALEQFYETSTIRDIEEALAA